MEIFQDDTRFHRECLVVKLLYDIIDGGVIRCNYEIIILELENQYTTEIFYCFPKTEKDIFLGYKEKKNDELKTQQN